MDAGVEWCPSGVDVEFGKFHYLMILMRISTALADKVCRQHVVGGSNWTEEDRE